MALYASIISALVIAGLAIFVNEFASQFDAELNACGLGEFKDGACQCVHPYVGAHCEVADCGYGRLINSLFESSQITTPNPNSEYGCACESKFWGFSCSNCTAKYPQDCSGPCKDTYFGARCDTMCKEGTASDAEGFAHAEAGGTYNFFVDNHGICLNDGSVRCNPGRAGEHCEFECLDCLYGSCNLADGTCDCFQGYYGDLCNATCPGRCSGNNGVCQDDGTCSCDNGFTGADCSLECCIRDGGTAIGRVHGQCNPLGGCICDADWSGPNCDCNDASTCGGRGTCINNTGICGCEPQFQGARCEMCNDLKIGPFCQYDRFQCPSQEVQNGAFVAINTRGDYACKCNAGFQGRTCETCTPSAYPKNGTEMCSFVVPASLCNRGAVKDTYQGTGIMCNCEQNFDPAQDCGACKTKYFGSDCEIFCDVLCTNSGGECTQTGCSCPRGMSSVNGECVLCGGDVDCAGGECVDGRCICDPGFYGDSCSISAPVFDGKVCNGYSSVLEFETADCETDTDCTDTEDDTLPLANQQVALRANQFGRAGSTFCHRLDTPIAMKDTEGCCVDANADGKCDAANLLEFPCTGEIVSDICNQRVLEGEVNVFQWCTSVQLGCLKNGECADPVLCEDRCDAGLNSTEWEDRWGVDHAVSMETVMNESWKFPIHFADPYNVRDFYNTASLDDVCPSGSGYNFCRDALIPPDATIYNSTHKFVNGWEPMPSFHTCELDHHIIQNVNGVYIYNFSSPIWAQRIELVSDTTRTAAFGRLGQGNDAYIGETNAYIDSIALYGKGDVELIIYNYTTDSCVDLMRRSATTFAQCKQYAFYEFEYDWDDFCDWRDTLGTTGGFEQRCYDQSLVCAGCEDWQENCENLPLESEYPSPMPPPCTPWDGFCEDYLNVSVRQTGTCAYTKCDCEGYGVGGEACNLQCVVPRFVNSESACGADLNPPWGQCEEDRGVMAFGMEQGECNCFNGGDPNLGCALTCTGEQDCSSDVDTPFSFVATNCSEFADVYLVEEVDDGTIDLFRCHVNLRDSLCNYYRGRCECATPYTTFTTLNQTVYHNMENYRVALMQGYEIDEYTPFAHYVDPGKSMLTTVKTDVLCTDPYVYPITDSFVCDEDTAKKNTDTTHDEDFKRCKDYTVDDCGKIRNSTIVPQDTPCEEEILDKQSCLEYSTTETEVLTMTNEQRVITKEMGRCSLASCTMSEIYEDTCDASSNSEYVPYEVKLSGFCQIPITTAEECAAAGKMINLGYQREVNTAQAMGDLYAYPSDPLGLKGCYYEPVFNVNPFSLVSTLVFWQPAGFFFNPFGGFNQVEASSAKRLICKKTDAYLDSQLLAPSCTNCTALQYAERDSKIFLEDVTGDGFIMSDCLILSRGILRNQNKIYLDNNNYLIWDLGGEKNIYRVDLTTSLNQISPNGRTMPPVINPNKYLSPLVRLYGNFQNKVVGVRVFELNEDVTLDVSAVKDWNFVTEIDFELKPDRPTVLTIEGTCAGEYHAGAARTGKFYNLKASNTYCSTTILGPMPKLSVGMPFYSVNPAEECMRRCDGLSTGFDLHTSSYACTCADCAVNLVDNNHDSYTIEDLDEPQKTPAELQGDWIPLGMSGEYKLRKNHQTEFHLGICEDKQGFKGAHCTIAPITKQQCYAQLSEIQSCAEYLDGACQISCTAEGAGCCDGHTVTAAHASFNAPYVYRVDVSDSLVERVQMLYTPKYECLENVKPYVHIDNRICSVVYAPLGTSADLRYDDNAALQPFNLINRDFGEAFMLDPIHPLAMPDKAEECARRCAIEGFVEFIIVHKLDEERCLCNNDCTGLRLNVANPSTWSNLWSTITYTFDSYRILDTFVEAYAHADVEMSCEDNYVSVDAGLPEFDGIIQKTKYVDDFSVTSNSANSWYHVPELYNVPDGYFKVFNNEVPTLMTKKCVWRQSFDTVSINTRFLKFSVDTTFLPHAIEVRPYVSTTNVVQSETKTGCIIEDNAVTFYDFMPTNLSNVVIDCKYTLLAAGERCTNGIYHPLGTDPATCSAECGSAFHVKAGQCFCDPYNCADRTIDAAADSFAWGGDDCDFELFEDNAYCADYVNVAGLHDLVACAAFCKSAGASSFDVYKGGYQCACAPTCDTTLPNPNYASYRFKPDLEAKETYIHITDRSCEHYGHRTIMDEAKCARAASEFEASPLEIFHSHQYGRCKDATNFFAANTLLDCASTCGTFSVKRLDNFYTPGSYCSASNTRYTINANLQEDCAPYCVRDRDCNWYTFDNTGAQSFCRIHKTCIPEFTGLPGYKKNEIFECACSENCEIDHGLIGSVGQVLVTTPTLTFVHADQDALGVLVLNPLATFDHVVRLVDIDNDGDLDLFMTGDNDATRYYKNVGDSTSPSWSEQYGANNPLNGVHCGLQGAVVAYKCYFTFGDIDNDGDIDALYTELLPPNVFRVSNYYRNDGTPEVPNFVLQAYPGLAGSASPFNQMLGSTACTSSCNPRPLSPHLIDIDNDGDLDLIVGKDASYNDEVEAIRVYRNNGGLFVEAGIAVGDPTVFDSVNSYKTSFADLDNDGKLELFGVDDYMVDDGGYTISNTFYIDDVTYTGEKAFGDLDGDGDLDMITAVNNMLYFTRNEGSATLPNFYDPPWGADACAASCTTTSGFQSRYDGEFVTCKCTSDFTSVASALNYMIYQPDDNDYETYTNIPTTPRGCSMDYFTDEKFEVECTDCICIEGDGNYESDYVEVTIGTCISNGYLPIGLRSECYSAFLELGYDSTKTGTWNNDGVGYDTYLLPPFPLGCVYDPTVPSPYNEQVLWYGDGSVDCSVTQTCICKRSTPYVEVTGTCESNDYYYIKTERECEAANTELNKGSPAINRLLDASFSGCAFNAGALTLHYPANWQFVSEGTAPAGTVLCRKVRYPSNDYTLIFDDTDFTGEICNKHGFYPIYDQDQCDRGAVSLGLPIGGAHPSWMFDSIGDYNAAKRWGCEYWITGSTSVRAGGDQMATPGHPIICAINSVTPTTPVQSYYALREILEYTVEVESKYVISSTCGAGYDEVGSQECELAKLLFATVKPDCSNLCKHSALECEGDEACICHSDTPVTVFDSNASCVICGGGEEFDVKSTFFNENGNTRGCIYSEETSCSTMSIGWTQYIRAYDFTGNDTAYQISNFQGYCPDSVDIRGDYENMQISEILTHCQRLCRQYEYFSINRDSCKCTSSCELPNGVDDYTTFLYLTDFHPEILEKDEFVRRWDDYDPNIECFKDLDHDEYVRCDWIRALKHFARGASYRVGDCHNLGPGVGEGVASQIPCSGHGFLSGGTCACDYSEQFEIKDTGVGLSFELPTLRQTPFRGKDCSVMCPGFDLWSMDSVCSGHGRCESDGRCACEQGFVGYKCHLECEESVKALTCSGHGVCNVVERPVTSDLSTLRALNCSTKVEEMFLARDRVIEVDDGYYYMHMDSLHLIVDFYRTSVTTIVDFSTATETDFIVVIDDGDIQNDPDITICQGATLVKTFEGTPLSIIDNNGNYIVHNWNGTDQITVSVSAGVYTYFCPENPELTGAFIVEACPSFVTRNATIDDFYMKGIAFRQPFDTNIEYPYMPCVDSISLKREEATHPLLQYTTPDVYINCSLLPGMFGEAYTIICGQCVCESSSSSGHWTGHDCRTPSLGFLGEDGKTSCPGMVNEIPCNGRGTCDWGSIDGLGNDIFASSDCFCGDTSIDANFTTAPRNHAGDLVFHAMNFGIPLYQDAVSYFEGNTSNCFEGTEAVAESECLYDKTGTLTTLEARIVTDQEYILSVNTCAGFADNTPRESIERTSASGDLVIEGTDQSFRCAAACFGHYRFKANGKIGGILMREELSGTFEENVKTCGFLCLNKANPTQGDFDGVGLRGFSVSSQGTCYCESYGAVLLDADWRYYEYAIPYREVDSGLCILNNELVYKNNDASVNTNPGQTPEERIENCARECQAFQNSNGEAVGFSYFETNAVCYCETLDSSCTVGNPAYRRFNFEYFNTFRLTQNAECLCGLEGGSDCFSTLSLPGVKPSNFVLQQQTQVYEDFVCLRNNNYVCKASEPILKNYVANCACKSGFTGPLCETPRMMCILGGSELDGSSCECPHPEAQNPKGCCAYGLYWDQVRYTSFSPLQDFVELADNIFYKNSLLAVCKPLTIDSYQSPGSSTDEAIRALRQHNYVATTKDHKIITSVPCSGETEVSLYKAVYKFTETTNTYIGIPLDIFADETVAYFSSHNAKMRCLDHCTINFAKADGNPRGFTLKLIEIAADTSAYVGEENNIPYAFRCYCNKYQAYVDDGYKTRPTFAKGQHSKLIHTVKPDDGITNLAIGQTCKLRGLSSGYNRGQVVDVRKYLHGETITQPGGISDCKNNAELRIGTAPAGATIDISQYRQLNEGEARFIGLRLPPDDPNADITYHVTECARRCGREGFDAMWANTNYNPLDTGSLSFDVCMCFNSHETYSDAADGGYDIEPERTAGANAYVCNIMLEAEVLRAIRAACYNSGFDSYLLPPYAGGRLYVGHCFNYAECEQEPLAGSLINTWDFTGWLNGESVAGDVYDIVYPKGPFECMQTDQGIVQHVDVAGLDRNNGDDGFTNEIGVAHSLAPEFINVKHVHASTIAGDINTEFKMQQCIQYCTQQKESNDNINSMIFKPAYETIETVFAEGLTNDGLLPRCWGPCTTSSECEGNLQCFTRENSPPTNDYVTGLYGCVETDNANNQYGLTGTTTLTNADSMCAIDGNVYLLSMECQCTEHDPDFVCNKYTLRSTSGYCDGGTLLGAPLPSTDPLYNTDRALECKRRCEEQNADNKAFYIKVSDQSCGCSPAANYCKLIPDAAYQAYDVGAPWAESCNIVEGYLFESETGIFTEPVAERHPNPLACNIESYLDYGTIMDTGTCECPLYDFEPMHQTTSNYVYMGNQEFNNNYMNNELHYEQTVLLALSGFTLEQCKQACDDYTDCVEISFKTSTGQCEGFYSSDFYYNNLGMQDWNFIKVSDRACATSNLNLVSSTATSIEECMKEVTGIGAQDTGAVFLWGTPRGYATDNNCYKVGASKKTEFGYVDNTMDPTMLTFNADGNYICNAVGMNANDDHVPATGTNYEKSKVVLNSDSYEKLPTYLLVQEAGYLPNSDWTRYRKALNGTDINRYCPVGEVLEYEEDENHVHANPHYCMQECRKKIEDGFILSRGDIVNNRFKCYCAETFYDNCILQERSAFKQYKVHKYNTGFSSTERLVSPLDPQIGGTRQCKCQGYYISGGEAFSCPANTFKNSQHCTAECEKCPKGKSSEIGALKCEQCPAGQISSGGQCEKCDIGKYATILDISCQICTVGRFTFNKGMGQCTACPSGWFDNDPNEGLLCTSCLAGQDTKGESAATSCTDCPRGYYSESSGTATCTACQTGRRGMTEAADNSLDCNQCFPGKYQNEEAAIDCLDCPAGKANPNSARPACTSCDKGQVQASTGQLTCAECGHGYYADQTGLSYCKGCTPGRALSGMGAKTPCKACSPGLYSSGYYQTTCLNCDAGRYSQKSEQSTCSYCPNGQAQPASNQVNGKAYGESWCYGSMHSNVKRDSKEHACDSYYCGDQYTSNSATYMTPSRDCWPGGVNQMIGKPSDGVRQRRQCWTGFADGMSATRRCNYIAGRNGDSTISYTGYDAGDGWIWCRPPSQQQFSKYGLESRL